ncbi:MAG: hypothetical protein EOP91_00040 [Lysobacteraceae bacterium]|nr:MAG: hypothetical protein EOP91_00040 [Xanthomonadaceae bacterium]
MNQNLVSIVFDAARLTAIDAALASLEAELEDLVALPVDQRRDLFKMGDKSEVFCRSTLTVLSQNPKIVNEGLGLPEALADMAALDALRPRLARLRLLLDRGTDTETALGADIFATVLEGYGLLRVSGKSHGLEREFRALGRSRFPYKGRKNDSPEEGAEPA